MNRQIRVEKLLVQLNVSLGLLVAQSKFQPSKRQIRLLSIKFSYLFGR